MPDSSPLISAAGGDALTVVCIDRLTGTRTFQTLEAGLTITEMLAASNIAASLLRHAELWIANPLTGRESLAPRSHWDRIRPRPGMELTLRAFGGKGHGGGKSVLSIVLGLAVMAAAAFAGPAFAALIPGLGGFGASLVGGLVSGVIGIAGKMLVNALIPPAKPAKLSGSFGGGTSRADSPTYSISGTQNSLDPYGVVPRIYGRFRFTPKYAARPYTEIVGSDQYVRCLFDFGYGPLSLEDHKIGETPLDQYVGVETNIHPNWDPTNPADALTLFMNDPYEEQLSIEIANDGIRTPAVAAVGTLTFSGNASAAETVTIGTQVYTFRSSLSSTANEVLIGAAAADTIDNLAAAVNRAGGAGSLYSATTAANASATGAAASASTFKATAITAGTAGNSIASTETMGSASWGGATLSGGAAAILVDALTEDEKWVSHQTQVGCDEFSFDLTFANGLFHLTNAGKQAVTVRFDGRYRPAGSSGAWTYLSTAAANVLRFTGQPANSDTVTIAGKVYTFQTTLTNTDGHVAIGVDLATSIANLAAAINLGAGSGTAYAAATTRSAAVDAAAAATTLTVTARHLGNKTGPDGNGIACSESGSNTAWDFTATQGGLDADKLKITGADSNVRIGDLVRPAANGQYELQLRRLDVNSTDSTVQDRCFWTALRSINLKTPVNVGGRCLVEMRIKATDQLNGVVNTYNAIATSLLRAWNGTSWDAPAACRNPAWIYADILTGSANGAALLDSRLNLAALKDWGDACAATDADGDPLYSCDGVFDFKTTVYQALADVASTGRATVDVKDGLFSIVRDVPQAVPVQHIGPRNSWGSKGTIVFPDPPHALRIPFKNEQIGWQDDERTVYADGYDASNATKFEVLQMPLVTRAKQIWRDGRYLQAAVLLRPATYQCSMDPEWMQCGRGDLVLYAHDVIRVGIASGRVKSLSLDGSGDTIAVTLDEEIAMEAGKSYALSVRRGSDNATLTLSLLTIAGTSHQVELAVPLSPAASPEQGDLATFGEAARVQLECLVKAIEPDTGQNALLTLIDAAPAVHLADQGAIPPYEPLTTALVPILHRRPPVPVIGDLKSDETVLQVNPDGSYVAAVFVPFGGLSGGDAVAYQVESWFKRSGSDVAWSRGPVVPAALGSLLITGLDSGATYDLRFRSVTNAGVASEPWTQVSDYLVIGDTSAPPVPINPQLSGDTLVSWSYPAPPKDFTGGGFRIKAIAGGAPIWNAGFALVGAETLITATRFDIASLDNGQWTIMVKAVDRSGNESTETMFLVVDLGPVQTANAVDPVDLAAADFPGTIVNGSVTSHVLTADLEATAMWPSDPMAPMWSSALADAMWGAQAKELVYTATQTPPTADIGSTIKIAMTTSGAPVTVTYSKDGGATFLPWPGAITAENIAYQYRFTGQGGAAPAVISALSIIYDVEDEQEVILDLAIAATTGTTLPLTKSYRFIDLVRPELVFHTGETAIGIRVENYGTVVSDVVTVAPLVKALDSSGAAVAGHARFLVHGAKAA